MEIIIALDIGLKRTGIARSDIQGILVKAMKTIDSENIIQELDNINKTYQIQKIIIGLPVNTHGSNDTELMIKNRASIIKQHLPNIEIVFENEVCSSKEAEERLKNQGIKLNKDNKSLIDAEAAAVILEQHFSHR